MNTGQLEAQLCEGGSSSQSTPIRLDTLGSWPSAHGEPARALARPLPRPQPPAPGAWGSTVTVGPLRGPDGPHPPGAGASPSRVVEWF